MALYKYFSEQGALRFFRTGMVRFSQPAEFNDPLELRPHIRGLADDETIHTQHSLAYTKESIDKQIHESLAKLTLDSDQLSRIDTVRLAKEIQDRSGEAMGFVRAVSNGLGPAVARQMNQVFNDNLGIFCLTEEPLNLLMWAHYGDHHRGVVVEFDETHPFFDRRKGPTDDLRHFRKVEYNDMRPSIFLSRSDAIQVFYTKSREWEYEREWRLITPLPDATTQVQTSGLPIALFEVPGGAMRSVLTGSRINHNTTLELSRLIRSQTSLRHIKFERTELHESRFCLKRVAIPSESIDAWLALAESIGRK